MFLLTTCFIIIYVRSELVVRLTTTRNVCGRVEWTQHKNMKNMEKEEEECIQKFKFSIPFTCRSHNKKCMNLINNSNYFTWTTWMEEEREDTNIILEPPRRESENFQPFPSHHPSIHRLLRTQLRSIFYVPFCFSALMTIENSQKHKEDGKDERISSAKKMWNEMCCVAMEWRMKSEEFFELFFSRFYSSDGLYRREEKWEMNRSRTEPFLSCVVL